VTQLKQFSLLTN
jgi:hypothetical protein